MRITDDMDWYDAAPVLADQNVKATFVLGLIAGAAHQQNGDPMKWYRKLDELGWYGDKIASLLTDPMAEYPGDAILFRIEQGDFLG